jgi:hypothetical protein
MAARADKIYVKDISYGDIPIRRGNWSGRLPEIDHDSVVLETYYGGKPIQQASAAKAIQQVIKASARNKVDVGHTPPVTFQPGSDLVLTVGGPAAVTGAILWYRHVNHGERWSSVPMQKDGNVHRASVPSSYTDSPYPLQYYFEFHTANEATLYPPFNPTLSNQPYYAIMPA